ncbi:MAG: hypothetical protein IJL45_08940 [Prevotella sp.]|nr:hypothetical protein [Prevotella sp.]MBQ6186401.1 hypothetical protein [Prevotella sp.]
MTDYDYIMALCRRNHFTEWNDSDLREYVGLLQKLSRQELFALSRSRWVGSKSLVQERMLKEEITKAIFKDKIGKRERRIKTEDTEALIAEFRDKRGGCVSLARKELRERYKAGTDRYMIAEAFNAATKNDQQWLKWQIRKERYANSSYKRSY